jgi:hypothetical protein
MPEHEAPPFPNGLKPVLLGEDGTDFPFPRHAHLTVRRDFSLPHA